MKGTLHLQDAASRPAGFSLMVKPVGAVCNLGCRYCYYLDKPAGPRMSPALLEAIIRSYADACEGPDLNFIWHGGEPLLAGLDFYRQAVVLERRYAGGRPVFNSIQTNGTLITPEWAAFFRDHNFLVGISIDGPEDLHNRYRPDRGDTPSFSRTLRGLQCLREAGTAFNTLTTVNHASEGRGAEVYTFLKQLGSKHMQFLPVLESGPAADTSVSAEGFGRFMADIFDLWVRQDVGTYYVQLFDAALAAWCGLPGGLCTFGRRCEGTVVVDHSGSVYLCDHCVDPSHRLGHLPDTPLRALLSLPTVEQFAARKTARLPRRCLSCPWLPACNGACPQHRLADGSNGARPTDGDGLNGTNLTDGVSGLCEGYRYFFAHAAPQLDRMRALLAAGRAPADIMLA